MADDEDKLVTKPFKFVTGNYTPFLHLHMKYAHARLQLVGPHIPSRFVERKFRQLVADIGAIEIPSAASNSPYADSAGLIRF